MIEYECSCGWHGDDQGGERPSKGFGGKPVCPKCFKEVEISHKRSQAERDAESLQMLLGAILGELRIMNEIAIRQQCFIGNMTDKDADEIRAHRSQEV